MSLLLEHQGHCRGGRLRQQAATIQPGTAGPGAWSCISALALPGIWPQGNHDFCSQYTASFGRFLQERHTRREHHGRAGCAPPCLGLAADDMSTDYASRIWADGILEASQPERQWIFLRHVGTYAAYGVPGPYVYPADGDSGWCKNSTERVGGLRNAGVPPAPDTSTPRNRGSFGESTDTTDTLRLTG